MTLLRLPGDGIGIIAVHDVSLGPTIGGLRMSDEVTPASPRP